MSKHKVVKHSDIQIQVGLDEHHNPIQISWTASDSELSKPREVKAIMMSLWDEKENNSMRVDLWNQEFMVEEMKTFVYQTMISMAESLERATGDAEAAEEMKDFAVYWGKKTGVLRP